MGYVYIPDNQMNGWNTNGQPVPDRLAQFRQGNYQQSQQASQTQSNNGIIWVQGEAGAKSYMVTPGNSVLLMDSECNSFYIKSSDPSGMPLPLRVFDYSERSTRNAPDMRGAPITDYVTREEFNALTARIEEFTSKKGENDNG